MGGRDFYSILGVSKDASDDEIRKAYKKKALKYHPDKNKGDPNAEHMFKDVAEAYEVLSDSNKRAVFDRFGEDGLKGGMAGGGMPTDGANVHFSGFPGGGAGFTDPFEVFSQMFGGMGGAGGMGGRPGNVHYSFSTGGPGAQHIQFGGPGGFGGGRGFEDMFAGMGGMQGMPGGMHGGMGGGIPRGMGGGMSGGMGGRPRQNKRPHAPSMTLPSGTVVMVHGLQSAAHHNGKNGTVQDFDPTAGRYEVVLDDDEGTMLRLLPQNVQQVGVSVKVAGTSDPSLNGLAAVVLQYDSDSERYHCQIGRQSKMVALKPDKLVIPNDTLVRVTDLKSAPQHNNKWGRITAFDEGSGRYDVSLPDGQILRVKQTNIRL